MVKIHVTHSHDEPANGRLLVTLPSKTSVKHASIDLTMSNAKNRNGSDLSAKLKQRPPSNPSSKSSTSNVSNNNADKIRNCEPLNVVDKLLILDLYFSLSESTVSSTEERYFHLRNFDFIEDAKFSEDAIKRLYTPKNRRKQDIYEQLFTNWRPVDDFILLSAMIHTNDINLVFQTAGFTRPFTLDEIKLRWQMFLCDDVTQKHVLSRFNLISLDHKMLIWLDLPFSLAEIEVLSRVPPYANPTHQDFVLLKTFHPDVFAKHRSVTAIEVQWRWLLAVGMLEHCDRNNGILDTMKKFTIRKKTLVSSLSSKKIPLPPRPRDPSEHLKINSNEKEKSQHVFFFDGIEDYELPQLFSTNVPFIKADASDIRKLLFETPSSCPQIASENTSLDDSDLMETDVPSPSKTDEDNDQMIVSNDSKMTLEQNNFVRNANTRETVLNLPRVHFQGFTRKFFFTDFRFFIGRGYSWLRPHVDLANEGESLKIVPKQALVTYCRYTGAFTVKNIGEFPIRVNGKMLKKDQGCRLPIGSVIQFHRCVLFFNADAGSIPVSEDYPFSNEDCFNQCIYETQMRLVPRSKILTRYTFFDSKSGDVSELMEDSIIQDVLKSIIDNVVAKSRAGSVSYGLPCDRRPELIAIDVAGNSDVRNVVSQRPSLKRILLSTDPAMPEEVIEIIDESSPKVAPVAVKEPRKRVETVPDVVEIEGEKPKAAVISKPVKVKTKMLKKQPKIRKKRSPNAKKEKKPRKTKKWTQPSADAPNPPFFQAPLFTGQGGRPLDPTFLPPSTPVTVHTLSTTPATPTSVSSVQVPPPPTPPPPPPPPRPKPNILKPVLRPIVSSATSKPPPVSIPLTSVAPVSPAIRMLSPPTTSTTTPRPPIVVPRPATHAPMVIMPKTSAARNPLRPPPPRILVKSVVRHVIPRLPVARPPIRPIIVSTAGKSTTAPPPVIQFVRPAVTMKVLGSGQSSMVPSMEGMRPRVPLVHNASRPIIRMLSRPPLPRTQARPLCNISTGAMSNFVIVKPAVRSVGPRLVTPSGTVVRPRMPLESFGNPQFIPKPLHNVGTTLNASARKGTSQLVIKPAPLKSNSTKDKPMPKSSTAQPTTSAPPDPNNPVPVKRGRGRPRKYPIDAPPPKRTKK